MEADVVIIGGGSAGCALAGRLVERGTDVLLLEAGPDYGPLDDGRWPPELTDARMLATTHDWGHAFERWTYERARLVGGCSAHNGAIAAVGHRSDYDAWGLAGWSGADVESLFAEVIDRMRVRTYTREEAGPFHARCLLAAERLGWRMADDLCDLDANDSFGLETVNVVGTLRWNAAFAYLDPVRSSNHLRIVDHALVDRIIAGRDGKRVIVSRDGDAIEIHGGTVVLCAGVYGTPAILQRSGVGPADALAAVGVTPVVDMPEVGAGLHDHPMAHADRTVGPELQRWLDAAAATGFLPEEQTLGKALSSQAGDGIFDLHVFPVCASDQTSTFHGRVHVEVACMTPQSRGEVMITSADPGARLHIDHRYLSDDEGHDLAVLRDGLAMAEAMLDEPELARLLGERITDMSTAEAVRASVAHYYHPVGTCRMGNDSGAVCDADGRVRGFDGVVVADASLMPQIPRGNTNLPTVMIGERIARSLMDQSQVTNAAVIDSSSSS